MKKLFEPKDYAQKITTPAGKARWASLKTPKGFQGDEKEHYLCDILLTEEEAQPIIDTITGIQEKLIDMCGKEDRNVRRSHFNPFKTHADDERVPEGFVQFKSKKRHFPAKSGKPASRPVDTYVDGKKIDWDAVDYDSIGNDSIIRLGLVATPYYVSTLGLGVTLKLQAVKVIELQKFLGSESSGFDDEFADGESTTAATSSDDDNYFD